MKSVLDRRFGGRWSVLELDLISNYLYHISAAPALGEYSLNSLLELVTTTEEVKINKIDDVRVSTEESKMKNEKVRSSSFVYAREPLVDRLHELPHKLPVLVLFGDNDWLYKPMEEINKDIKYLKLGGQIPPSRLNKMNLKNPDEISFNGIDITLQIIPEAGHHIYLDNSKGFTYSITSWLKLKGLL